MHYNPAVISFRHLSQMILLCLMFAQAEAYIEPNHHEHDMAGYEHTAPVGESADECDQVCQGAAHFAYLAGDAAASGFATVDSPLTSDPGSFSGVRAPPPHRPPKP